MSTINQIGLGLSGSTGTGTFVGANTPTLITPVIGAATGTSVVLTGKATANNVVAGFATTATAGATTTLTVSDAQNQEFTGTLTQTVVMPVTSTLAAGQQYYIINNSSGVVTVQSSGANTIQAMNGGSSLLLTCVSTSGTTAASWQSSYLVDSAGVSSITGTANQVIASASVGAVTLSTPQDIGTSSSPTFANLTASTSISTPLIIDSNGNKELALGVTPSAVNYVGINNSATGTAPYFLSAGTDTNVGLNISTQGTGVLQFITAGTSNQYGFLSGTNGQHSTIFNLASGSASRTITFPDLSGTLALITADTTFTPVLTSSGGGTATYSFQTGNYTQIGNLVFFEIQLTLSALPSSGTLSITGLPVNIGVNATAQTIGNLLQATVTSPLTSILLAGGTVLYLQKFATGSVANLTVADCTTTSQFYITGFYHT